MAWESSRQSYSSAEHHVSPGISVYWGIPSGIGEAVTSVCQLLLTFHCSCSWGHIYPTHHPCQDMAGSMLEAPT